MTEVVYRSYREGDGLKIVDLFWQAGPHIRTVGFWNWINRRNPFGESIVEVAERNGKIIGHYAVMPVDLWIEGASVRAGFAIQAIVHTAFRNLKNLLHMADRLWERCAERGIQFVYAFPNDNIWKVNLVLMAWEPICDFKSLECPVDGLRTALEEAATGVEVRRIALFDDRFDDLWSDSPMARSRKVAIARNAEFLNWRFFEHPLQHYVVFVAETRGKPVGYIVLKFYRKGNKFYGHIVDILTVKHDAEFVAKALLREAFRFFEWARGDIISCWMCPSNPYHEVLGSLGFAPTGFNTHFGYRAISGGIPEEILLLENWYLTMAHSDAF